MGAPPARADRAASTGGIDGRPAPGGGPVASVRGTDAPGRPFVVDGVGAGWRPEIAGWVADVPDLGFCEVIAESLAPAVPPRGVVDLRERGLDVTRPMLVGIDGSKALRKAVVDVLDHPVIQRCQLHKIRNVKDHLPQRLRSSVGRRMTDAYHAGSALEAEAALLTLAKELDRTQPGAAGSLREGLHETLTVLRLGVPPTLARTLRSTNAIESMISVCREHAANVKRWRDGQMALRWTAAGMIEAGKQFRRVNGHLHLPTLRAALQREIAEPVGPVLHNDEVSAA